MSISNKGKIIYLYLWTFCQICTLSLCLKTVVFFTIKHHKHHKGCNWMNLWVYGMLNLLFSKRLSNMKFKVKFKVIHWHTGPLKSLGSMGLLCKPVLVLPGLNTIILILSSSWNLKTSFNSDVLSEADTHSWC